MQIVNQLYRYSRNISSKWLAEHKYKLIIPNDNRISCYEVFLLNIYTKFEDFKPNNNDIIVDIGASWGDYALLCSKYYHVKHVYAFEPFKPMNELMHFVVSLNNVDNITIYDYALGKNETSKRMPYNVSNMIVNTKYLNTPIVDYQVTKIKTLDSFMLTPSILKIDVEGNELEVLKGAKRTIAKYHPKIIIETHSDRLRYEVLKKLENYTVKHIIGKSPFYTLFLR